MKLDFPFNFPTTDLCYCKNETGEECILWSVIAKAESLQREKRKQEKAEMKK